MKLDAHTTTKNPEGIAVCAKDAPQQPGKPEASVNAKDPKHLRLLLCSELVSRGDFVADEHGEFQLWEGPSGFRADAFVKPIYRRDKGHSIGP